MLLKRQQTILDKYLQYGPTVVVDDDLPKSVRFALESIKNQETLWCDVERYIRDKETQKMISRRGIF